MGLRGPPAEPSRIKAMRGNPGQRPIMPEPEPALPATLPAPPRKLGPFAAEEWRRIAPELYRLELLTVADLPLFASYCQAYAHWREISEGIYEIEIDPAVPLQDKIKLWRERNDAAKEMLRYAIHFGMTPAARARLAVKPAPVGRGRHKFGDLLAS